MQLIFETERVPDIKDNMSSLDESLEDKLNSDAMMDSLKHTIYGNKENIQKQNNIPLEEESSINNNKLEDEDFKEDVEENEDFKQNETEKSDSNDIENSSPEESLDTELPDSNESQDNLNNSDTVQLKTDSDGSDDSNQNDQLKTEQSMKIEEIEQEVNDILAEKVSNLTGNIQIEMAQPLNSIVEEIKDSSKSEIKENDNDIEALKLSEDNTSESTPSTILSADDSCPPDGTEVSAVNDDASADIKSPQNEFPDENTIDKSLSDVTKEVDEPHVSDDVAKECSIIEEDKTAYESVETVTIQDENEDIVDTSVEEPMDVEEVCEDKNKPSDNEGNEITLLDSPVNVNVEDQKPEEENNSIDAAMECDKITELANNETINEATFVASNDKVMIIDKSQENSEKVVEQNLSNPPQQQVEKEPEKTTMIKSPIVCRLSNNLNILSDDEDEPPKSDPVKEPTPEKQLINLEDDDDIMLIDEDTSSNKIEIIESVSVPPQKADKTDLETGEVTNSLISPTETKSCDLEEATSSIIEPSLETEEKQNETEETIKATDVEKPLLPENFLNLSKKNIADMTREELEEFCLLKIVESIVDRSNLSEIKTKLRVMAQSLEEFKKKAMMLTKQNKDLEVVLRSVQDEQKRASGTAVTPLKITRSVGMQVFMSDKVPKKKSVPPTSQEPGIANTKMPRSCTNQTTKPNKSLNSPTIPVPRLIPANNAAIRGPTPQNIQNNTGKQAISPVNGIRSPVPIQKIAEKRPASKGLSVTVDLTDDEPPSKIPFRSPAPPVRLVPQQNLLAPQRAQFGQVVNGPRKVYIPISGPQGQQIKPGQTIMLKTSATGPPRPRAIAPNMARLPTSQVRMNKNSPAPRHPAPLPDVMKQYQPPNWKALPPAPDLKLSKVENGIVISWKIDGYQEDSYEEIASYQLYAYQETQSPPSSSLWKKIGDVKALPLPMACTLTQFMAGYRYYFAVRAVDVKSRLGPFSIPGSILLLNKM